MHRQGQPSRRSGQGFSSPAHEAGGARAALAQQIGRLIGQRAHIGLIEPAPLTHCSSTMTALRLFYLFIVVAESVQGSWANELSADQASGKAGLPSAGAAGQRAAHDLV